MLIKLLEVLSGEMLVKPLPWALWLVLGPLCRKDMAWDLSTSHNLQSPGCFTLQLGLASWVGDLWSLEAPVFDLIFCS